MNISTLNWAAIVVAAVSAFVIGGLWYSLLFAKAWMKANGFTKDGSQKGNMAKTFGLAFLWSLVMSFNLAMFLNAPGTNASWGATAGFLAGFGWVAMSIFIIGLFERRTTAYMLIHAGYVTVSLVVMGAIIGAWTPSRVPTPTGAVNGAPANALVGGEWQNRYMRIALHSGGAKDTTTTMEADSTNWEAILQIKPIRTHFLADGSYYSEYRNLKDSVVRRPAGTWSVNGDSLTMTQTQPDAAVYTFYFSVRDNIATFHGWIDFDGRGKPDDEYFGIQKRFE